MCVERASAHPFHHFFCLQLFVVVVNEFGRKIGDVALYSNRRRFAHAERKMHDDRLAARSTCLSSRSSCFGSFFFSLFEGYVSGLIGDAIRASSPVLFVSWFLT